MKGVNIHEQLTRMRLILLHSDYTNVLMVRAGAHKVCEYGLCANNLLNNFFLRDITKS